MTPREVIPTDWIGHVGQGPLGLGHDIATTTKKISNWSSLCIMEHAPPLYIVRLFVRWRTDEPDINISILDAAVSDIEQSGRRGKRLCVDASNERYHAKSTRKHFLGRIPVKLISGGDKVSWAGQSWDSKTLLGDLYSAAFDDNVIAIPQGVWLRDDHRLVQKEAGKYKAQLGKDGGHGDTFDAGKLALWALTKKGGLTHGSVNAAPVGNTGSAPPRPGIKNPHARFFERKFKLNC